MSIINKAAVLNPFSDLTANILNYVPRATNSEFGIVAIGSGINVDALGRIYLDTQEYSDRLTAIEAQAASSLATQKSEVAAAIAQVNLIQSQTITALTLEVSNLKTNLTDSITATQTDLINRADQLAQNVTNITQQLTQDKATFTQEIQDALDYLKDDASVASALRTPRKINGTSFDGRSDITTNAWGATRTFQIGNKTNSINGTSNVDYSLADIGAFPDVGGTIQGTVEVTGNLSVGGTISATLEGTAARAAKLQVARKIQGVDFDGTEDINLPTFTTQTDGLVPKRVGATNIKYLREDGIWVIPTNTTYALLTKAIAEVGTATAANTISAQVLKDAIKFHAPPVTNITGNAGTATKLATAPTITLSGAATGTATSFDGSANISIEVTSLDAAKLSGTTSIPTTGNAGTATKLQTPRTINGISFDGTQDISLPEAAAYSLPTASASVLGGIKVGSGLTISNSVLSVGTLNQSTTGNAATSTKLQTARTISLTGNVTGSASFDGSANASITTAITGLGVANGIATLDSNGQVPSTQLPSYVDDVLEYANVAAFPTTGVAGKIYVETTGNTTYRWGGTAYVKITSGEVSSVAGKTGVVTLTKSDVGLANADNTADSVKDVASASKLTTARTIGGVSFDGTTNINLPGVNTTGTQATTGNAATATKLATARTINGVGFDGTANIVLPVFNRYFSSNASYDLNLRKDGVHSEYVWKNSPTNTIATAITTAYSNDWASQLYFDHGSNQAYVRSFYNGTTWTAWKRLSYIDDNITGSAASLTTARTLSWTGDATGSLSFNGSANVSAALTLANSGVAAGTYKSVTVDAKGRVTAGADVVTSLITSTAASGVSNVATDNTNTFLNIVEKVGTANSTTGSSSQITGAGTVTVASDAVGKITITGSQTITGNAATATKLATARAIGVTGSGASGSVLFDGTGDVSIPLTVATQAAATDNTTIATTAFVQAVNIADTGSAATALKLKTARTIGGVSFDGSANINLPGVNTVGTQSTTGNATTATKLQTARTIGGVSFDGSANINLPGVNAAGNQNTTGNSATATKLATGRTINGVAFDGTANIYIPFETPTATETVEGKAKIATTAIAQAGINDTDIITAKKLRDAFNASGEAPIFPSRAWGCVNAKDGTIYGHGNIQSFSVTSKGVATVVFKTPMPHSNYAVLLGDAQHPLALARVVVKASISEGFPENKTTAGFTLATGSNAGWYGMENVYFLVVC